MACQYAILGVQVNTKVAIYTAHGHTPSIVCSFPPKDWIASRIGIIMPMIDPISPLVFGWLGVELFLTNC